jgi:hypothetical protein
MVSIISLAGSMASIKAYQCEECGMQYRQRKWAEECEAWCRENKSCNLDIVKHAIR